MRVWNSRSCLFFQGFTAILACGAVIRGADPSFKLSNDKNDFFNITSSYITYKSQKWAGLTHSVVFKKRRLYLNAKEKEGYYRGAAKIIVAPQRDWDGKTNPWIAGTGIFNYNSPWKPEVEHEGSDSIVLFFESPVETTVKTKGPPVKGLQVSRTAVAYPWSTVMRNRFVMRNAASTDPLTWALWHVVTFQVTKEKGRFCSYFHKNPDSRFGATGYKPTREWSAAIKKQVQQDVKPGIVLLRNDVLTSCGQSKCTAKIGADTDREWIAMVDTRDNTVVVHICPSDLSRDYGAHRGANMEIFWSYRMVELEWLSPYVSLKKGDSVALDVWTCHGTGTGVVVHANRIGAALDARLDLSAGAVRGEYALFYGGTAHVECMKEGTLLKSFSFDVSPLEQFSLSRKAPEGTDRVLIRVTDRAGSHAGYLDWFPHSVVPPPYRERSTSSRRSRAPSPAQPAQRAASHGRPDRVVTINGRSVPPAREGITGGASDGAVRLLSTAAVPAVTCP